MEQINPGTLNKHIKIMLDEIEIHSCRAAVSNVSGTQQIRNGGELNSIRTRFLIRYTSKNIDNDMEVLFKGKRYPINYVNEYGYSHQYIEILSNGLDWSGAAYE